MSEIGRFFAQNSEVHQTLSRLTKRLDGLGIDYAVCGGMAIANHGYYRTTDDLDLLVTPTSLKRIHDQLEGLGYVPKFRGSKHLRDADNGVAIEFLETGQYPGDGKPKPVAFPDPADVSIVKEGIKYLSLPALIELKIASGMTAAHRGKDLVDVQALISASGLPRSFADQLNPYVRPAFYDCWEKTRGRFVRAWDVRGLTGRLTTLEDLIDQVLEGKEELQAMLREGVRLDQDAAAPAGHVMLFTDDPGVARRHDLHDAQDFMR